MKFCTKFNLSKDSEEANGTCQIGFEKPQKLAWDKSTTSKKARKKKAFSMFVLS